MSFEDATFWLLIIFLVPVLYLLIEYLVEIFLRERKRKMENIRRKEEEKFITSLLSASANLDMTGLAARQALIQESFRASLEEQRRKEDK